MLRNDVEIVWYILHDTDLSFVLCRKTTGGVLYIHRFAIGIQHSSNNHHCISSLFSASSKESFIMPSPIINYICIVAAALIVSGPTAISAEASTKKPADEVSKVSNHNPIIVDNTDENNNAQYLRSPNTVGTNTYNSRSLRLRSSSHNTDQTNIVIKNNNEGNTILHRSLSFVGDFMDNLFGAVRNQFLG